MCSAQSYFQTECFWIAFAQRGQIITTQRKTDEFIFTALLTAREAIGKKCGNIIYLFINVFDRGNTVGTATSNYSAIDAVCLGLVAIANLQSLSLVRLWGMRHMINTVKQM